MAIITIIITIVLGCVEGITEFIPVSSTAHILLTGKLLELPATPFFNTFTIAIQTGAILAAIVFFWKQVWADKTLIPKVIIGFIPTAIAGILLHKVVTQLFSAPHVIALSLIIGGIALLFIKPNDTLPDRPLSYREAFLIGMTQIVAFIPGVSRAGATLIGGTLLKIPRKHIVTFSFLLGIPTIIGAGVVSLQSSVALTAPQIQMLLLGTVVAFITALGTMKIFIDILSEKPLTWFGYYRIAIGIIVLLLL